MFMGAMLVFSMMVAMAVLVVTRLAFLAAMALLVPLLPLSSEIVPHGILFFMLLRDCVSRRSPLSIICLQEPFRAATFGWIIQRLLGGRECYLEFIVIFIVPLPVSCVVDFQFPAQNSGAAQIVHRQISTSLVFVFQEGETLAFTSLLVANELQPDGLAVLREDRGDITFSEFKRQSTNVDVGCISIICMPRSRRRSNRA